jgi:sporulation protein YlmC with PRC-barrel domain
MTKLAYTAILLAMATATASAQTPTPRHGGAPAQILSAIPADSVTVTHWYKQNVYDPSDNKIGEVMDVLIDRGGNASALIIGVGGFLGAGEKDVAVPFDAVQVTTKGNNKYYLVMNATKDSLKSAKGFKYDRNAMTWMPEDAAATTGSQPPRAR